MFKRFEEVLKEKNVTIYQVSKLSGIPESTLYMWKRRAQTNPKAELSATLLKRIADALGATVDEFLVE